MPRPQTFIRFCYKGLRPSLRNLNPTEIVTLPGFVIENSITFTTHFRYSFHFVLLLLVFLVSSWQIWVLCISKISFTSTEYNYHSCFAHGIRYPEEKKKWVDVVETAWNTIKNINQTVNILLNWFIWLWKW